jgi:hypothetical protein
VYTQIHTLLSEVAAGISAGLTRGLYTENLCTGGGYAPSKTAKTARR